jgi:SAM-dependent MidA family methyltransferase
MMIIPPHLAQLPPPSPEAQALSDQLSARIVRDIAAAGGAISFARYMELALYAPGLGYYSAGSRKLGADGDFITAPELSPLYARTLARQLAQLHGEGLRTVLEIGAGSGALAADLLQAMDALGVAPDNYYILELSADLRERQHTRITQQAPALRGRVRWMNALPREFEGVIIANELLDATPVHRVTRQQDGISEQFIQYATADARFVTVDKPATGPVLAAARQLDLPADGYQSEINLSARVLVESLAHLLKRGVMLFIDYGFPAHEFYHPQRNRGTLMCHYHHHAHDDPFAFAGLQDITTHVDFSAVTQAAQAGGASLLGYTSQAMFLINCGITELLSETPASDARTYAPLAAQVQKLTSPAEMGELFKVIALGKAYDAPLIGYARGDKSHTL